MNLKYVLVIGDGMADNPVPELGGLTPLQYARIPTVDMLAGKGIVGSVLNVPKGLPPGSDTAILSIFGCDPNVCYKGRGPLEAAGAGIKLSPGDVAYRCNLITVEDVEGRFEDKAIISHSAGSISGGDAVNAICALLDDGRFSALCRKYGIIINPSPTFRHMTVHKGADITGIKLIPPHDHLGEKAGGHLPSGCIAADQLRELMLLGHEILMHHPVTEKRRSKGELPANGIWFWAEGIAAELPDFVEKYGRKGGVVSAVPLCHGIASMTGLDMVTVEGATGEIDTNLENKVSATLEILKKDDFAALHFEAPDECTHNGDLPGKIQAIEWLDSRVVKPLMDGFEKAGYEYRMLILSDHKTLTSSKAHDGDPVPFLIYDSRIDTHSGLTYCETDGEKGPYVDAGTKLMDILFQTNV